MTLLAPGAPTAAPAPKATPKTKGPAEVRTDIQGLRALSLAVIMVYHLWHGAIPGGYVAVDVFFVISGFLITSHLLVSRPSTGRDLTSFWMKRIRRLLPAALLVATVTLIAARLFAPDTQWKATAQDAIASVLYYQNWSLANSSVDYLAADNAPTAFQHYWTLSAEEQFYACWPVLMLLLVFVARWLNARFDLVVFVGVGAIVAASLMYSISYTQSNPEAAYFVTPTRAWEFALGGLTAAAVVLTGSAAGGGLWGARVPGPVRAAMVWAGFAGIVVPMWLYTADTPFPGWTAIFPAGGTALVIAGFHQSGLTPNRLLAVRPMQHLGDVSYSVYLWHWPMLILLPYVTTRNLNFADKIAIIAAAVVLGTLTKSHVEDRYRFHKRGMSMFVPYRYAAIGMAGVVALGVLQVAEVDRRTDRDLRDIQLAAVSADPCFAAASLEDERACPQPQAGKIVPSPAIAPTDRSFSYQHDCQTEVPFDELKSCEFGDTEAERNVALVGNSHAVHWLPALQKIALERNFKITTFFSERCFATESKIEFDDDELTKNCYDWGQKVLRSTSDGDFDLVIKSERTYREPVGGGKTNAVFAQGYADYLEQWADAGRKVLVIRDTPLPDATLDSVPDCVAQNRSDFDACSGLRSTWVRADPLTAAAKDMTSKRVSVANLNDWLCPDDRCQSVIGRSLVYFDASHLTATYSRSLAPMLEPHVLKPLGIKSEKTPDLAAEQRAAQTAAEKAAEKAADKAADTAAEQAAREAAKAQAAQEKAARQLAKEQGAAQQPAQEGAQAPATQPADQPPAESAGGGPADSAKDETGKDATANDDAGKDAPGPDGAKDDGAKPDDEQPAEQDAEPAAEPPQPDAEEPARPGSPLDDVLTPPGS